MKKILGNPKWLKRRGRNAANLPDGGASGWLHNESRLSGLDCYRRVKGVWDAVTLAQARALPRTLRWRRLGEAAAAAARGGGDG